MLIHNIGFTVVAKWDPNAQFELTIVGDKGQGTICGTRYGCNKQFGETKTYRQRKEVNSV